LAQYVLFKMYVKKVHVRTEETIGLLYRLWIIWDDICITRGTQKKSKKCKNQKYQYKAKSAPNY